MAFITEDQVEEALHWLNDNAANAAKARAEREYVELYLRTVKAQIMSEHDEKSAVIQEREAHRDERYQAHLEAIRQAVEIDEHMRWMRGAKEAILNSWQTQSANERGMKA